MKQLVHKGIEYAVSTCVARDAVLETVTLPRSSSLNSIKNISISDEIKSPTNTLRMRSDIVFITSRYRSGSTVFWNAFRQLDKATAYYEPFNERRFFDPESRGTLVDSTHIGVSDYWKEYEGLEKLNTVYDEEWTRRALFMDESAWNPNMLKFIDTLIDSANGRPIMQFNRIDFRLPWIKSHYPNAKILHLWRNPREQWCSTLINIENFPFDSERKNFPDHFYLMQWVEDLKGAIPVFRETDNLHPYQIYYLVWKISWLFGQKFSSLSISYDSLVSDKLSVLKVLGDELEIDYEDVSKMALVFEQSREHRWPKYASSNWFDDQELECERLLNQFFN